jgi:hypothetical protein
VKKRVLVVEGVAAGPKAAAKTRRCDGNDFEIIHSIINEAAQAYKGFIPNDCWKEPGTDLREVDHNIHKYVYRESGS